MIVENLFSNGQAEIPFNAGVLQGMNKSSLLCGSFHMTWLAVHLQAARVKIKQLNQSITPTQLESTLTEMSQVFPVPLRSETTVNFQLELSITDKKHQHLYKNVQHVTKLQYLSYPVFIKGNHNHQFQEALVHMLHSVLQ